MLAQVETYQRQIWRVTRASTRSSARARSSRQTKDLKAAAQGAQDSAKLAQGRQEGPRRLEGGLGQAGAGAQQLRAGLAAAAAGAGKLQARLGRRPGRVPASCTPGSARRAPAPLKISAGLQDALVGATALKKGSARRCAAREARRRDRPGRQARQGRAAGVPQLAADVNTAATTVAAATGAARRPDQPDRRGARRSCAAMTTGKSDPRYRATLSALTAARDDRRRRPVRARRHHAQAGRRRNGRRRRGREQVGDLSAGLSQAATTARRSSRAASRSCATATRRSPPASASSSARRRPAHRRAGRSCTTAPPRSRPGLGQLTSGAGQLQTGLAGGVGPTGQLVGGLGTMQAGVAKFRGALPSTKDLEKLQAQSPGLFDSGLLRARGHPGRSARPTQDLASFAVNLDQGGNAGQIVVVPKQAASTPTTRELGDDLKTSAAGFAKPAGPRSPSAARPATSTTSRTRPTRGSRWSSPPSPWPSRWC